MPIVDWYSMRMIERTKSFIKSAFPGSVRMYRRVRGIRQAPGTRTPVMADIFSRIYLNNSWADAESVSGRGSTLARTDAIRRSLPALLESVGARSLLDAPCGDFNWMRDVELGAIEYVGADVVPELIAQNRHRHGDVSRRFVVLDITSDQLPEVDAILCRDCFIHLSFKHTHAAISNFKRSNSKFLLATTHTSVRENSDVETGGWRSVNLLLPPFNFPPPVRLVMEDSEAGKCLGMWRLENL
ncbi:MAG: class I SAM-dependent methyltransferase [Acidobacteria bacterium]|nr:class I SAM-dependent methyltransferase [Acidobacteriota bacterium]